MNSLTAYGSSDEEPEPKKRKASPPPNILPLKKRKLPSLPPSLTLPVPESDPSKHQGRIRTQPHVEGQFASYVYIPVPLEGHLGKLVMGVLKHARSVESGLNPIVMDGVASDAVLDGASELHVSLSRPIYLRHHQREAFKSAVKAVATTHPSFSASFATFAAFNNDELTRAFLALEIGAGHSNLRELADALTPTLRSLYQKEYYAEPRFHASIAWTLLHPQSGVFSDPSTEEPASEASATDSASGASTLSKQAHCAPRYFPKIVELPVNLTESLTGTFGERLRQRGVFDVTEVRVRIGKEIKAYTLLGR